jgi:uridine kinase
MYIASPLVLWINYLYGQTDIIPAFFLLITGLLFTKGKFPWAGCCLGLAIGTKFSLALAIPFIVLYFVDNPRLRRAGKQLLINSTCVAFFSYFPAIYSNGFRKMVLGTPETKKIFNYFIPLGGHKFYIFPALYLLLLYWIWKAGRTSPRVLFVFISLSLLLLSISTPASIGWSLWGIPLLILMVDSYSNAAMIAFWIITTGIIILHFDELKNLPPIFFGKNVTFYIGEQNTNIVLTLIIVSSAQFFFSVIKRAVNVGDVYQLAKKPFGIAIAGDSGVGKDTLADALVSAFGRESTLVISGDGYHRFERGDLRWKNQTHLDPRGNNLALWAQHLKKAQIRSDFKYRDYDHHPGRFVLNIRSTRADLLISQGLHALYPEVADSLELRLFLTMDEPLRKLLKVKRDSNSRNTQKTEVLKQIQKRVTDYKNYILPQMDNANLHINISKIELDDFELQFKSNNAAFDSLIVASLVSISDLNCSEKQIDGKTWKVIKGTGRSTIDLMPLFKGTFKHYNQIFAYNETFQAGIIGVMQYIVFSSLENIRNGFSGEE